MGVNERGQRVLAYMEVPQFGFAVYTMYDGKVLIYADQWPVVYLAWVMGDAV